MSNNLKLISDIGLVPVIVMEDSSKAVPLAKALCKGGIPVAEITFRTAAAKDAIQAMAENVPEILVGAGTIHSVEQAKSAVAAGAKFIISAGINTDVVRWCVDNSVDVFPGCASPSDIETAIALGLKTVKFFPAESNGGVKTLKTLSGPYHDIKMMPTGGINETNVNDYLALDSVVACGGAWIAPQALIDAGEFDKITELCQAALSKILGFELGNIGINTKDDEDAKKTANLLASLFSLPVKEFPGCYFAGSMAEVIKGKFLGTMGHIAILTNNTQRAVSYFEHRGIAFDKNAENRSENGKLNTIYFKDEIGGFAIHLKQK